MGFKLNKNKAGESAQTSNSVFGNNFKSKVDQFSKLFGDTEQSKSYLQLGLISLVVSVLILLYLFYSVPRNNDLTRSLGELRLLSQTIPRQASDAMASGSKDSFKRLSDSQTEFAENFETVRDVHPHNDALDKVEQIWSKVDKDIASITSQRESINKLSETNKMIADVIPGIQSEYNSIVAMMLQSNMSGQQVSIAKNQVVLAERISRSLSDFVSVSNTATTDYNADIETFGRFLNAELNGNAELGVARIDHPDIRESLMSIKSDYDGILKSASSSVLGKSKEIGQSREAVNNIAANSEPMLTSLNKLSTSSALKTILPGLLLLIALSTFLYSVFKLLVLRSQSDQVRVMRLQDEYDRNQNAILRLLDEIADLADGDLSSYATVSEDFTGAIADSINFAIDQLRDLVSRINETSQEVAKYTQNTQQITHQLAEASEHQAQEIAGASTAINEIALSIEHVSANAEESAEVAQRSVAIASNGADVVNRSIQGMDTIREQIQETSKRIKRLGESSQEIGNIVSLINDIADQTNILALNAAIQASMAGEAGRGFAVVADEVQRLAERSASATKQIESLVKTIQTDTNEAVISMEQTTSEVVRGANLAKDAGVALDEIQLVSNNLEKLIANISESSKLQSASAGHIANTMNIVQEITSQTTSATFDTARSVSELANMADSLRESVTNFKLPE
ncbi:methyl-accepting chemotaxis protein [Acinetobacter lanii]|uniref:Methyl-accepting chemotaxis protein n=1 Tax=Acinetobacter lanii TaxID=2715163 RepID=A0A6G8S239_9GAMM|nr:methyl-accepting chemotaxis protein [Acinetobacter lanii]QIO08201.1 methyl-accepting chemotaxis protein [Acinetobacter lanii]